MPFYVADPSTPQAQLPRFTLSALATIQDVENAIANNSSPTLGGVNYRTVAGELQIYDPTTGLWNPIYMVGAAGAEQLDIRTGVA